VEGGQARVPGEIVVGLVSDTHGHLYPPVRQLLEGVDHIIHAGDVGSPQVLAALKAIAPVTAVRGNCDYDVWAASLPVEAMIELGGVRFLVGHIAGRLRDTLAREQTRAQARGTDGPPRAQIRVVVTGHTHRVEDQERDGVLYVNPGSAGPERFGHPRTMARLHITPPAQDRAPAQVGVEFLVVPGA
jgi:putative phosphoesterase